MPCHFCLFLKQTFLAHFCLSFLLALGSACAGGWEAPFPACSFAWLSQVGTKVLVEGLRPMCTFRDATERPQQGRDHWQPLPSMPTPCYGASAFLQGNKIFGGSIVPSTAASRPHPASTSPLCIGGRQGKLPVTAFEAFDVETRSWTRYPSVPSRRAFAACAMADGVVFSLGGLQQPGPHNFYSRPHFVNTVEMFDPAQGVWRKPNRTIRMKEKRADFVAGCLGGRVVAVGGLGNQSCPLDSVEGFSLSQKKWEPLPPMPTGRCSCSSCPAPSLLFIIGGVAQGPSGAVEALCLRDGV
uniref:Kelch domain-containing protein 8B n=1 Tax=Zonotrichia albicollis TaxID=44394 RepID=A0A8D2QJS6_ZONAL